MYLNVYTTVSWLFVHTLTTCTSTSAFKGGEKLLFSGVVASFSKLPAEDSKKLWAMLKYYGGEYRSTFTKATTHLIVSKPDGVSIYSISGS